MSDQRTALVLGGGGITGIAWEIGVLAGLAEAGTDLTGPDLVVGTSAGSVVGALLTSGSELAARTSGSWRRRTGEPVARLNRATLAQFGWAMPQPRARYRVPPPDRCARPRRGEGRAHPVRAGATRHHRRAPGRNEWPQRQLVITAVDSETGEFRTFDRDSGCRCCTPSRPAAPSRACTRR